MTRFLEIGSRFGGSLWQIAQALPVGSRVVSCDSGKGMGGHKPGAMRSLEATIDELRKDGYDAHLVPGHSQGTYVVKSVKRLGPYDAIFIDGDHEYIGARADFQNFGNARIVALHDIAWQEPDDFNPAAKRVEVPRLWAELKEQYRHVELIDPAFNYGIGVLWTS